MIVYTYSGGGARPCMVYKGEGGMALCTVGWRWGVCHCEAYKGVWLVCWFLLGS